MKKIPGILLVLGAIFCISFNGFAQNIPSKTKLKVLFVGYDPAKPMPDAKRSYPGMMSKEGFAQDYPVRMPAFKALLGKYFTEVRTMDCRDWKPADSDPFDVTVFDFKPKALEPERQETNADGSINYISAKYLPDNFSKPVVFIASTASEMGSAIGLKLDWLCLCLDADAHHIKQGHPIFNGPVQKVKLTTELKNTPDGIYHYTTGKTIPKQIPMWAVQNAGYSTDKNARIGLVSRGGRFDEGPDAEVISSGVCAKDVGAVALGRHGNFFLWGFGASPAQMSEEAKSVFVNVVAYMKQYDKKIPITRKYNERMATTNEIKEIVANASKESYVEYIKSIKEFNEQNAKEKKRIDDKKAAGQALTSAEEESLTYLGNEQPIQSWEEFLKGRMGSFADQFGTDAAAFQKYMTDNFDYIWCDPKGFYTYSIDEDVKKIGIGNHDVKLLEKCVDMLKQNDEPELALRVLKKYTPENFTAAKDWSAWLSKNKSRLYFTETDGYRFKINTYK